MGRSASFTLLLAAHDALHASFGYRCFIDLRWNKSVRQALHCNLSDATPADTLQTQGFVLLSPAVTFGLAGCDAAQFAQLSDSWNDLPSDPHLRDGGHYRFRRHASLRLDQTATRVAERIERPHWQPVDYNALHGGFERWFAPITDATMAQSALLGLITGLGRWFANSAGHALPFVEAHQFRIDTAAGIGRPTPEGAHRDGVDFVAVLLINRIDVRGGETRVFQADGPAGIRFTMTEPGSALLLDDARVIHETTPLQPAGSTGHRDTLVLTYRRDGFLDPS